MILTENNRVEYKEKLNDSLEKEVVAFVNAGGGEIYIGIRNDGSTVGVENPDKVQLKIKDRLIGNIRPSIMGLFDILTEHRDGKTIIIVNLAGGMEKPYYIKDKGRSEAGCFVRIGSSSQPMTEAMIDGLMSRRHPVSLANMTSRRQDLTFRQLKIFYEGKDKELNENFTRSLDFYTPAGKFNQVAYLFADENKVSIRIGKYAGTDKMELIENEEYGDCSLVKAMQKVLDKLDIENVTQARKRPMKQRLEKSYVDKEVLHEVVINAFAHNDYSSGDTPIIEIFEDKFVVTSYGGLVEGLVLEDFYSGTSMPRNREIMRIFKDLEFVEQLGSGIPKIIKAYGREVVSLNGKVLKIMLNFDGFAGNVGEKTREKTREKILNVMRSNPLVTTRELADLLELTPKGVEWHLTKLKKQGVIRRKGPDKGGHWEIV